MGYTEFVIERRGQVLIGFKCDSAFREEISRKARGGISQFVRDAVVEKLRAMGVHVPEELAAAPSREGKGGPKKKKKDKPPADETPATDRTDADALRRAAVLLNDALDHGPVIAPLKVEKAIYKTKRAVLKEKQQMEKTPQ